MQGVSGFDGVYFLICIVLINVVVRENVCVCGKNILLCLGVMHQIGNLFSNSPRKKVLCVSGMLES